MRKNLKISHAEAMNNGILFYSKRHKNYVAIAFIDEQDNITTEWTTRKKSKSHKDKHEKITEMKDMFTIVPALIILYVLVLWVMSKNPIYGIRTFLMGYSLLVLGSFIVRHTGKRREEKIWYKFHSAEHMVLNAYKKLKRVPSLEEIYQYSRFRYSCGTNQTTQIVMSFSLMFACSFIPDLSYRFIGSLSVNVIIMILLRCGFLNFLQFFTTAKPTDRELVVAIAGLTVWLENEKKEKEKSRFSKFLHRLFPRIFH